MKLKHLEVGERGAGKSTLVLLHGYGAEERDLVPLAAELGEPLPVVSLQGPLSLGGRMRAWYHLEQTRDGGFRIDPAEVAAADALVAEAVAELAGQRGKLVLLGFSQGACMAVRAALAAPQHVRALISLSGVPASVAPLQRAPAEALRGLKVFAAHGVHDPLLPLQVGHALRAELEDAGADVTFHEYPMGHMVVPDELADLTAWLAKLPSVL